MIPHEDHDDGSTSPYYPRVILCIPGPWTHREELAARFLERAFVLDEKTLRSADGTESFDAEFGGPDSRMVSAFQASACRVRPSLGPAEYRSVSLHRGVLYVLSDPYGRSTAARAAARMLEIGRAALDCGGVAIKCDSAGIAHSAERWRQLDDRMRSAGGPDATRSPDIGVRAGAWNPLFDAFVRLPIINESEELYSCGMHLLGCPDGMVGLGDFPGTNIRAGARALEAFLRSLRIDTAPGSVALDHAFRALGTEDRFWATLEPCSLYLPDEFFWNRWGCFRLRRSPGESPGPSTESPAAS